MITVTRAADTLTVRGHAGYAPKGQDIVCAGVSVLVEALAQTLDIQPTYEPDGAVLHHVYGGQAVDMAMNGFCALERAYPAHVQVIE